MPRFVINKKLYDTEKMVFIGDVSKSYKLTSYLEQQLFGQGVMRSFTCKLYRSAKGNWLLTRIYNGDELGEAITEIEAEQLLMKSNYDAYVKIFGELEEA